MNESLPSPFIPWPSSNIERLQVVEEVVYNSVSPLIFDEINAYFDGVPAHEIAYYLNMLVNLERLLAESGRYRHPLRHKS